MAEMADPTAYTLPELTRALRAYGSRRGNPGSDHDRFFAPLVEPLRAVRDHVARGGAEPWRAVDRAQGAAMAEAMRAALGALAAGRFPKHPPERRALEAELEELAEPVLDALAALDTHADGVRAAEGELRLAHWRAWGGALGEVFARADRAWEASLPALADPRGGSGRLWRRVLRGGAASVAAALLAFGVAGTRAAAQPTPPAVPNGTGAGAVQETPLVLVRITAAPDSLTPAALQRQGFDVIPGIGGERLVVVDAAERVRLERLGASVSVVSAPRAPYAGLRAPYAADGAVAQARTSVYRSYDDPVRGVRVLLDSIARASNGRVRLDTLGLSFQGRAIVAAKVGPAGDDPARPNVVFMATYHAREWAATEMALRLLRHLASPPTPDARLDSLLARRDVWIVPVVNPDGYEYTFTTTRLWRKNRRPVVGAIGVDLNRNHTVRWGLDNAGSSPIPTSEVYRGPSPASEPEIQAIERWHERVRPVSSVSYHTFTGLTLYPIGYRSGVLSGDERLFRTLAGTDERPAVRDRLPGAPIGYQRPRTSWKLYPTNGEYTDFAYERYGTLAFTPELTSGYEGLQYYGFEFPDDEGRLRTLFEDNLPFALDVIEVAGEPLRWTSPSTGLATPRLTLESATPRVRVLAPAAPVALAADGAPLRATVDAVGGGRWQRRTIGDSLTGRPREITVVAGSDTARFRVLMVGGAEPSDTGWTVVNGNVTPTTPSVLGTAAWRFTTTGGTLRSPAIRVPNDVDTVSVTLWSQYEGDPFARVPPQAQLWLSRDDGRSFQERVLTLSEDAPVYYPEQRTITNVRGATLRLELRASRLPLLVDELAVTAHLPRRAATPPGAVVALRASQNPVREDRVRFSWPWPGRAGELFVYDLTGRLVWRGAADGTGDVGWNLAERPGLANGAYLVLARAGTDVARHTLYVLRAAR